MKQTLKSPTKPKKPITVTEDACDDERTVVATELEMILGRINKARHYVREISLRACVAADRNFGAVDDDCCDACEDEYCPGMIAELNRELDYLFGTINSLDSEVRRLEGL